jgi:peptidoglycan/xylan/chitin deacetylase (PgdA/CDA1 family)
MTILRLLFLSMFLSVVSAAQTKTIAITIDDLPYATLNPTMTSVIQARQDIRSITQTLKAHNAPAVAFVNEQKLQVPDQVDMRIGLLEMWLDAGVLLGNHTYSHLDLNKNPESQCEDEVVRGEVVTRRLMKARGLEYKYFRHPFLRTGANLGQKNSFEAFLKSRGYVVAPVTTENVDWLFNSAYERAVKDDDHNLANRLLEAYLVHTDVEMDYYEKMVQTEFGRPIAHIMLLHSDRLNGIMLDKVLSKLEARGYKFITLEEALKDPAYQTADNYTGPYGSPWPHRWAITLGKDPDFKNAPDPPKWVLDQYEKATQK